MLKDEQAHVAAIDKLEQQRQKQVTDYLEAKGLASTDKATVADVIEAAEQQTEKIRSQQYAINYCKLSTT